MENGISIQSNKYIVDIIQPGGVLHLAYCLGHSCSIYIDFSWCPFRQELARESQSLVIYTLYSALFDSLVNFFDFFLDFLLAARSPLKLLNGQPEAKILVAVFLLQKWKQLLRAKWVKVVKVIMWSKICFMWSNNNILAR